MKTHGATILAFACIQFVFAENTIDEDGGVAPFSEEGVDIAIRPPARMAPASVNRQLLVLTRHVVEPEFPRAIEVVSVDHAEDEYVPRPARRIYNAERHVVIVEGRELPYVTIAVVFVKDTADFADMESRAVIEETAAAIHEVLKSRPNASFDIECHDDPDGSDKANPELTTSRARRIHQEFTERHGVPAAALGAHGYKRMLPGPAEGTGERVVEGMRVLVVRTK